MAKYLINGSFKALRTGEYVEASKNSEEFILDFSETDSLPSVATLHEVAKANELKVPKKAHKDEVVELLESHLETLKLPEVNEMTDTQKVEEIVAAGIEAGKSDDDMLVDIVNSGISFKAAGKLFKAVMEDKGLRISAKERAEQAAKILADADFGVEEITDDVIAACVASIVDGVKDTNEKQALAAIRKYAKDNNIELPKVKKAATGGGRGPGGGLLDAVSKFMLDNREAGEDEVKAFIESKKDGITDGQLKKYMGHATRMRKFAIAWNSSDSAAE